MIKSKAVESSLVDKLFFAFIFIIPFIYFGKIIDPVLLPRQLFLTIFLAFLFPFVVSKSNKKNLSSNFIFLKLGLPIVYITFLFFCLISIVNSNVLAEGLNAFAKFGLYFVLFVFTSHFLINDELKIETIVKSIVIFTMLCFAFFIFQFINSILINGKSLAEANILKATFANKNLFSSILFLTLPFLINSKIFSGKFNWVFVFIVISIVLILQTKAVLLALLFFFISYFILQNNNKKVAKKILFFSVIITGLLVVFLVKNLEYFPLLTNSHTFYTRLLLWQNSLSMIGEHFFSGVGLGNWQIFFPKYGLDKFDILDIKNGLTTFQRPHNDFLWIFCETGILGFISYLGIYFFLFLYLLRLIRKANNPEKLKIFCSLFSCLIGYIVISLFDFPLERIEHQIFFTLIASIIVSEYYKDYYLGKDKVNFRVFIGIFSLVLLVFAFVITSKRLNGEFYTVQILKSRNNGDWEKLIKDSYKAKNYFYTLDPMSIPVDWYKGVAYFSLNDLENASLSFESAFKQTPYNIHVINNLASCYESKGNHKSAINLYKKALHISGTFEETILNLSAAYFNSNNIDSAFFTIEKCNVNCTDPKYPVFLPAILQAYSKKFFAKKSLTKDSPNYTNEELVSVFFESKKNNSNFDKALLNL